MLSKTVFSCFTVLVLCYLVNADIDSLLSRLLRDNGGCAISLECPGKTALCYEHRCRINVPCNKDNDCFFYGAGDVANGNPHPKCYRKIGTSNIPAGYGYCMLKERVGNDPTLIRIKGIDVDSLDEHPIDTHNMQ